MCDVRYGDGGGGGGGFLKQYLFSEEWEHVSHLVFFFEHKPKNKKTIKQWSSMLTM